MLSSDHHERSDDQHDHGQGHSHGGHAHSHAPKDFGWAFAIGAALNAGFVIFETTLGFTSHSLALLSDAGHNLSDVLGLLLAWGARRASSELGIAVLYKGSKGSAIFVFMWGIYHANEINAIIEFKK